jgi:hypothetical protein
LIRLDVIDKLVVLVGVIALSVASQWAKHGITRYSS